MKKQAIIPLDEYNELLKYKEAVETKKYIVKVLGYTVSAHPGTFERYKTMLSENQVFKEMSDTMFDLTEALGEKSTQVYNLQNEVGRLQNRRTFLSRLFERR